LFLTKQRASLRANIKEIDMGMSSLETEVSLWDLANKHSGLYERDDNWFEREVYRGANYLSGPVTVINFDYLENN
jgi:hypothetical protein